MNYAKAISAGNLGRQPELRYLPDGTPVTSLSVAVTDPPRPGASETSTWWHVSVFGRQAEICQTSLHKGARVLVEGRRRPSGEQPTTTVPGVGLDEAKVPFSGTGQIVHTRAAGVFHAPTERGTCPWCQPTPQHTPMT